MNRWSKNGTLARIFEHLQKERLINIKIEAVSLDSTMVKVHPMALEPKKTGPASKSCSPPSWIERMRVTKCGS
jgi:hypothetical protein